MSGRPGTSLAHLSPAKRELLASRNPLSWGQMRLWMFDRLSNHSTAYNVAYGLRLRGSLSPSALCRAIEEVVSRHGILRTRFPELDHRPIQVVEPGGRVRIPTVDYTGLRGDEAREAALGAAFAAEASRSFDLARGPVMRCRLLVLGPRDHALLLCVHHIAFDGWSTEVFVREWATAYVSLVAGRRADLPEPGPQYLEYARWQRGPKGRETMDRLVGHWRERLADAPRLLRLRTDRPRPAVQSFRGARLPVRLPATTTEDLEVVARRLDASLFMALLAAWSVVLHAWSGDEEVVIASPSVGRPLRRLESSIGFFAESLFLRVDLRGDPTLAELVGRVRAVALEAYEHPGVSLERLVEALRISRSPSHNPVSQVVFALQRPRIQRIELPGLDLEPMEVDPGSTQCDLNLSFVRSADGLEGSLRYAADLFESATVQRRVEQLETVVRLLAEDPRTGLDRLRDLCAGQDHAALLQAGGGLRSRRRNRPRAAPGATIHDDARSSA